LQKTAFGGSDICGCNYCKNFSDNKDNIYPDEIKLLFEDLGIDYKKECEVWHYYNLILLYHSDRNIFHYAFRFMTALN